LEIRDSTTQGKLVYIPSADTIDPHWRQQAETADCLLFDGTFWSDDEPQRSNISRRSSREMGHLPVGGPNGTLHWLAGASARQRAYVHINNTNPMLDRSSAEFAMVDGCGIRIAEDGDEFLL
jgi:pyrroloquinoline quinone biosynthesis protein B